MLRSETLTAQLCLLMRSRRYTDLAGLLPEWLANEQRRFDGDMGQSVRELQQDTFRLLTGIATGEETEQLMIKGLALLERIIGRNHPLYAQSLVYAATISFGFRMHVDAEARLREALAIQRRQLCADHPEIAHTLTTLGQVLSERGRAEEAEVCLRKALALRREQFGPSHAEVAETLHALGAFLHDQCRLGEAEPILREAHAIRHAALGPNNDVTNASLVLLALNLRCAGRVEEAEALLGDELIRRRTLLKSRDERSARSAFAALSAMLGGRNAPEGAPNSGANLPQPHYLPYMSTATGLANCLMQQGRLDEAEEIVRELVDYMENAGAAGRIAYAELLLAGIQRLRGEPLAAERRIRDLIAWRDDSDLADAAFRAVANASLAQTLLAQKRFSEAEPLLLQHAERLESQHGPAYIDTRSAYRHLARLYDEWDQPQRAADWREKAGGCYPD
jgi:tetratricopeptide (TPR) repeat protein